MKISTLVLALFTLPSFVSAEDFDAKNYHEEKCTKCHTSSVYTRDNRRVKNLNALKVQVARCDANLNSGLFPEEITALANHLNTTYYKFK